MMMHPPIGAIITIEKMNLASVVSLAAPSVAVDELTLASVVAVAVDKATRPLEPIFEAKDEKDAIFFQVSCNRRIYI